MTNWKECMTNWKERKYKNQVESFLIPMNMESYNINKN